MMKIGILIIFRNDEKVIQVQRIIELFSNTQKLNVCFVNNGSTDGTLELLREIKEEATTPISIIDVKKNRGYQAAIKAGIRYITNTKDLSYILCLEQFSLKDIATLDKVFRIIQQEKAIVVDLFSKTKCMIHKNVFSLHSVLEKAS